MIEFRYPLTTPPEGGVTMAVARHQSSAPHGPLFAAYVQDRHDLVYDLVESQGLEVISWGTGDHLGPGNEVWELIFGGVGAATAFIQAIPLLIKWIGPARRKADVGKPSVAAIKLKRPDGTEFEFGLTRPLTLEEAVQGMERFLGALAVEPPPGGEQ